MGGILFFPNIHIYKCTYTGASERANSEIEQSRKLPCSSQICSENLHTKRSETVTGSVRIINFKL